VNTKIPDYSLPLEGWRELIDKSWPAITAAELLRGSKDVWNDEGFGVPDEEEAIGFAAAGRLLRYGQSIHLSFPINRGPRLARLCFYLHRLRLDAAGGLLRSPWLNSQTISDRNDLIVFGRPTRMLRSFSTSVVMRPMVVNGSRPFEQLGYQRTLLANGHGDLLEILEQLSSKSKPFAIVVDMSPQGCGENSSNIVKVLPSYFPGVPIAALDFTGQNLNEPLSMHSWRTRIGDLALALPTLIENTVALHQVEVVSSSDKFMDLFIKKLGFMVWNLKCKIEETGGFAQEFSALLSIERTLRSLNVPLHIHEQGTLRYVRGGRYPIRLIESWLDLASKMKGRRSDIQELHSQIMLMLRSTLKDLSDARTGRSETIIQYCTEALGRKKRLLILVGNRRDAEILQNYIEQRLGPEIINFVRVHHMDGATAEASDIVDSVIYAGVLFPSRLHWLGLKSKTKVVLCHAFEQGQVSNQIELWLKKYALPSSPNGDKLRLWKLDWPTKEYLRDADIWTVYKNVKMISFKLLDVDGNYPRKMRVAELEVNRRLDDWLKNLLTEPIPLHSFDDTALEPTRDVMVLHLEGQFEPVRWTTNHQILRLKGDEFEVCSAKNLDVGDELLLMLSSEERVATQRDIFDMFVQDSHELSQILRVAEKWQDFVDEAIRRYKSPVLLNRFLKTKGVSVTNSTVLNWIHHGVIGPQNPEVIRLLAEVSDITGAQKMAAMVSNAITFIRNEHRRIGSDLRRAITISRNREVSAVQIGSRKFSRDVFDAMVQVVKIIRIQRPSIETDDIENSNSIRDLAMEFAIRNDTKIIFTARSDRSMKSSSFEDLDSFEKVLNVLVEGFFPMYSTKSKSLEEVENMLNSIPASYAGGMSAITKGKNEQSYFVQYEGERVDISRHIKLGKAFDPRYTLRLHFHWDEVRGRIVVHHAGQHLPTLNN
jgi:hypothetical protein